MRAASLLPAIALIAACGNVKIVDNPVASTDVTSTDASDAGTMDVGGGKADTAGFDPQLACANIFDCQDKNLLNSSPCKEKKCVSVETGKICDGTGKCLGQCQYVLKPGGVTCADPVNPAGECETPTCDDAGVYRLNKEAPSQYQQILLNEVVNLNFPTAVIDRIYLGLAISGTQQIKFRFTGLY